ncbi:LysM peptidoglycan-binding domain-containing protein [Anaerobacillus alkaliphilus]|uniref:LysM peptidoglycan-binding domain-containing protein n=1 Tax=Anaerobacillus alkaliphilus TaxID=1548597 RepID=A0A4Q0VPA6_9BACI|nr:L,D-transpeptidase family protein [Anaerobacillus alkaliphilus]RXI96712.1 LysM peptidoglycan-binding domain-containing protein [Anaerobacillus alkaliphilus]
MSKQDQSQQGYTPRKKRKKKPNGRRLFLPILLMVGIVYSLGVFSSNYLSFIKPSFVHSVQSQEELLEESNAPVVEEIHYPVPETLILVETIEEPSSEIEQGKEEKLVHSQKEEKKVTEAKVLEVKLEPKKQEPVIEKVVDEEPVVEQVIMVSEKKSEVEDKPVQAAANRVAVHEVQPKETLFSITMQYYLSGSFQGKVADFNGISNPETEVKAGMKLELPDPAILAFHQVKQGETLFSITMQYYQQGKFQEHLASYNGIKNPATDVKVGMVLKIPNLSIVKVEPKETYSLKINKGTNTLTVFRNGVVIKSFPIATGKSSSLTPEGTFKIVNKVEKPWFNPENIPGGDPRNPLGSHWLGLNVPGTKGYTYGIHGTNNPASIGTYASKGCIRMYNSDILWIYQNVPMQTTVEIVSK